MSITKFFSQYKLISLIVVAFLIGLIWRLEIEFVHGWHGLAWVKNSHYAVPIGLVIFMAWANLVLNLTIVKRICLNIIGLVFGLTLFYYIKMSLTATFIGGASAMFLMTLPDWHFYTLVFGHLILIPFMAIGSFILLKLFKQRVSWIRLGLSLLVTIIAVPASIFLLELIEHKGSHDMIHTLKSGLVIPFFVVAVGLVFIVKDPTT